MPRGGVRVGAGRPSIDKDAARQAKEQRVMVELLIPAFRFSQLGSVEIELGPTLIQDAYGKIGLAAWQTWFEKIPGIGYHHGHTITRWKLKLKMMVAAKKLLEKEELEQPFPPEVLARVIHRKEYDKFWAKHKVESKAIAAEHGTSIHEPEPYKPLEYRRPNTSSKEQFDGWRELIDGQSKGFSDVSAVPSNISEQDIPY